MTKAVFARWRILAVVGIGSLGLWLAVGCGDGNSNLGAKTVGPASGSSKLTAAIATSDMAVGDQRFTFVILDDDVPVTDKPAYVRFFKVLAGNQAKLVGEGMIPWAPLGVKDDAHPPGTIETELTGVYYANVSFDEAGAWGVGISVGDKLDAANEVRLPFTVRPKPQSMAIGEKAVAVRNPTAKDRPLEQIHTGIDPDPAFHTLDIGTAIASGKPSVIVFATPSFCETRTCGPSLQVAMKAQAVYGSGANFLHIEPYELDAKGSLVQDSQGNRKVVEAGELWRLQTEPWVFVVDSGGQVIARFEGPYALEELEAVLEAVVGKGG